MYHEFCFIYHLCGIVVCAMQVMLHESIDNTEDIMSFSWENTINFPKWKYTGGHLFIYWHGLYSTGIRDN